MSAEKDQSNLDASSPQKMLEKEEIEKKNNES